MPETARDAAQNLAVVLHDLAWLLPRTVGAAAMQAEPLSPTALEVMRLLTRRPGLSVNEVARDLGVAANNISTAVGYLADQGLLDRRSDPDDARVARLFPTRKAQAARRRREKAWGSSMSQALEGLTSQQRRALIASTPLLGLLAEHLAADAMPGSRPPA